VSKQKDLTTGNLFRSGIDSLFKKNWRSSMSLFVMN